MKSGLESKVTRGILFAKLTLLQTALWLQVLEGTLNQQQSQLLIFWVSDFNV